MEPANQGSAGGAASHDLFSEGMDGARRLLAGLSIRGDEVIAPLEPVFHGSENQFSQLLDSLRQMSVLQNDAQKQIFQIPLKTIFINALKSVGILHLVFNVLRCRGSFQVCIEFTSDLAICILGGSRNAKIVGDICGSHELAEATAIDKAFLHLRKVHNVVLVDISARKESSLLRTSRHLYWNVKARLRLVDFMIQKWHKCLDNLSEVQNFAYPKLKHANPMESRFAEPIYQSLQFIKRDSMLHIRSIDGKMKGLCDEKDKYVEASRSKSFFRSKASIKKAYFHDVDALALLLQWLKLEDCQYSAIIGEDGLYLDAVMLSFSFDQNMVPPGDMCIEARDPKKTIAKAHNATAREAIFYLEMHFNVEVAGYNQNGKVLAEQEMFVWKGLNEEARLLGANVLKFWEDMLKHLEQSISANKDIYSMLAFHAGGANEMAFIYDLIGQLEFAASKCNQSFKVPPKNCILLLLKYIFPVQL